MSHSYQDYSGGRSYQGSYQGSYSDYRAPQANSWGAPPAYDNYSRPPTYDSRPHSHYDGGSGNRGGYQYGPSKGAPAPHARAKSAYQDSGYDGDWRRRHMDGNGNQGRDRAGSHYDAPRQERDQYRTPPFSARQSRSRSRSQSQSWAEPQRRSRSQGARERRSPRSRRGSASGGGRGDHWAEPSSSGHYSGAVPFDHPVVVERRRLMAEQHRLREAIKRILGCAQRIKSETA